MQLIFTICAKPLTTCTEINYQMKHICDMQMAKQTKTEITQT